MNNKTRGTLSTIFRIIIWLILIIGGIILSINIDIQYFPNLFINIPWHIITFIIGIFLMKYAFKAASKGGKELAKSGRDGDIPRLQTNRLVTTGIYSQMRHPMLFGLMLIPLSVAFIIGSPSFILIVAPLEILFIAFMVLTVEEMECKAKFSQEYEEYSKKVPPVCFKIECLKELFK